MVYRPTDRTRARAAERRDQVVGSARGLAARGGWSAVTVAAVARDAGMSAGNVYTHFPDKAALLTETFRSLAEQEFRAVEAAVAGARDGYRPATECLGVLVKVFAHRALQAQGLAWTLLVEPADPALEAARLDYRRQYADLVEGLVEAGQTSGELPRQSAALTAAALVGAIGEALVGPLAPDRDRADPGAVVDALRSLCLRAAGAPPSPQEHLR